LGLLKRKSPTSILDQILDREDLRNLTLEIRDTRFLDSTDQLEHVPVILAAGPEFQSSDRQCIARGDDRVDSLQAGAVETEVL
jgi:hypothetical protein